MDWQCAAAWNPCGFKFKLSIPIQVEGITINLEAYFYLKHQLRMIAYIHTYILMVIARRSAGQYQSVKLSDSTDDDCLTSDSSGPTVPNHGDDVMLAIRPVLN